MKTKTKGLVLGLVKSAAATVLSGKGTVAISLPVKIFEPVSMTERLVEWFHYAPHFLNLARDSENL